MIKKVAGSAMLLADRRLPRPARMPSMIKKVAGSAMLLCLIALTGFVSAQAGGGTTSVTCTKSSHTKVLANYYISAEGEVSIEKGAIFNGVSYYVQHSSATSKTTGYTNLPSGSPKAGGAAVPVTGNSTPLTSTGTYEVGFDMQYIAPGGFIPKIMTGKKNHEIK